jgi:hypothetical protein
MLFVGMLVTGLTVLNLSCGAGTAGNPSPNQPPAASSQSPPTKRFTPADLAKLRWIEGSWRGTGDVEKPFFERYHFENESTLVTESFADESFSKITEVTRFELKNGVFGNGGEGARWAATAIDETSVTFEPVAKANNSFRFQRESKDSWKAILTEPARGNTPAKQINYHMERWPKRSVEVDPFAKPPKSNQPPEQ